MPSELRRADPRRPSPTAPTLLTLPSPPAPSAAASIVPTVDDATLVLARSWWLKGPREACLRPSRSATVRLGARFRSSRPEMPDPDLEFAAERMRGSKRERTGPDAPMGPTSASRPAPTEPDRTGGQAMQRGERVHFGYAEVPSRRRRRRPGCQGRVEMRWTPAADWAGAMAWWPRKAARRSRPTRGPMGAAGPVHCLQQRSRSASNRTAQSRHSSSSQRARARSRSAAADSLTSCSRAIS